MTNIRTHADNASICLPGRDSGKGLQKYHFIMIPGNPGTIGHYLPFLTQIQENVHGSSRTVSLAMYGFSLPNFTDQDIQHGEHGVLGLRETIDDAREKVLNYARAQLSAESNQAPIKLILCGHSLGAYICLEIVEWWGAQKQSGQLKMDAEIAGCLSLWPAIVWDNKSPKGIKLDRWLNRSWVPPLICFVGEWLIRPLPYRLLLAAIKWGGDQPEDIVRVTVDFIKSRHGIRQTVYLLLDMCHQIHEDRWTANVWGSPGAEPAKSPKLAFHYGNPDSIVDEKTRDELFALRGRPRGSKEEPWKPVMELDKGDIPHSFFEKHCEATSVLAAQYVIDMISA